MMKRLGLVVAGWLLLGCGGTSSNGPEASGGSATTGGAGSYSGGKGSGGKGAGAPPASQGAVLVELKSASPDPAGKSCPSGAATTFAVPQVDVPGEALSSFTYQHWVVDGDAGAKVACQVTASGSIRFEGTVQQAGRALQISEGTLGADHRGTARIAVTDSQLLSSSLTSAMDCAVSAAAGEGNFQVKPGSMWASFSCAAVVAEPSDYCAASGIFVLENCAQ